MTRKTKPSSTQFFQQGVRISQMSMVNILPRASPGRESSRCSVDFGNISEVGGGRRREEELYTYVWLLSQPRFCHKIGQFKKGFSQQGYLLSRVSGGQQFLITLKRQIKRGVETGRERGGMHFSKILIF